jgi:ribosomal protein S18 acetylase RimI-like enzyme
MERGVMVKVDVFDPTHSYVRHCLGKYFAELDRRFSSGFDPVDSLPADPDDMRAPQGLFLVATLGDEPVGCGAIKFHGDQPTELKRMWVSPTVRGLGIGRRLLAELERRAAERPSPIIRLETNRALTEAIALYRSVGYREVDPFNNEPYADHWFEKRLPATDPAWPATSLGTAPTGG